MFVDIAEIEIKAGDGGNGVVSFRREKFVPKGGPDGGDGGRGGDVIFVADPGLSTLLDFQYRQHGKAGRGRHGEGSDRHGRDGEDVSVTVPVGTVLRDAETKQVIADLTKAGRPVPGAPSPASPERSAGWHWNSASSPMWGSWVCPTWGSPRCSPVSPRRGPRSPTIPSRLRIRPWASSASPTAAVSAWRRSPGWS